MYELLHKMTKNREDEICFVCDDETITYGECLKKVIELGKCLRNNGVKHGDKVGIIMEEPLNFIYSLLAVSYCGGVAIPIYLRQGKERLDRILSAYEISFVISKGAEAFFENKNDYEKICIEEFEFKIFHNRKYITDQELKDIVLMLFSSGTTNISKAVKLSNQNVMSNIKSIAKYLCIGRDDNILMVKNLNHASSIVGELLVGLYAGSKLVLTTKLVKTNTILRLIQNNRITVFFAIPYLLENMLSYKRKEDYDISSLRIINFYGGLLSSEKIKELCETFPSINFIYSYGLTEASPRVTYIYRKDLCNHYKSCGKEIDGVKVVIRDENGQPVKNGIEGEITVEGPNVMRGYYKNPELTSRMIRNGILYTKDIGYKDEEGFLYVTGRKDNMFIVAGKNVHPEEIEAVINESAAVKESVIVYREDENSIEAYVLMNEGYIFDEKKIYEMCKDRLEFYKIPHKFFCVKDFERTISGKIKRGIAFEKMVF